MHISNVVKINGIETIMNYYFIFWYFCNFIVPNNASLERENSKQNVIINIQTINSD